MPRDHRDGPVVVHLSGDRARHLAERLFAPRAPADRLWDELATLGEGARVAHDWDPATGRLTFAVQGAALRG
jgi:hypothetical protein